VLTSSGGFVSVCRRVRNCLLVGVVVTTRGCVSVCKRVCESLLVCECLLVGM
jgi:hypothetical protein